MEDSDGNILKSRIQINSLDVTTSGSRILHGESQTVIRTDDVQGANSLRGFRIILTLLVDHVQLHGELAIMIGDDGIGERAGNIPAIRLDVLQREKSR